MSKDKRLQTIEIVGPESSGKSVLTQALAQKFQTSYAAEFAVDFLTNRIEGYEQVDLDTIAEGQLQLNLEAVGQAKNGLVFFDTGLLTIKLWSEIKYGSVSSHISTLFETNFSTHYFLCMPDLPWEFHPLREAPELSARLEIFEQHVRTLKFHGLSYTVVEGDNRLEQAVEYLSFTNP